MGQIVNYDIKLTRNVYDNNIQLELFNTTEIDTLEEGIQYVSCPICNEKFQYLPPHMFSKHEYKNIIQINSDYPGIKLSSDKYDTRRNMTGVARMQSDMRVNQQKYSTYADVFDNNPPLLNMYRIVLGEMEAGKEPTLNEEIALTKAMLKRLATKKSAFTYTKMADSLTKLVRAAHLMKHGENINIQSNHSERITKLIIHSLNEDMKDCPHCGRSLVALVDKVKMVLMSANEEPMKALPSGDMYEVE